FADVILNPTFPASEFNNLKNRQMSALRAQRSQPNFLADERISKALYGDHPASRASLTAEDLQRLTPEMLQKFHAAYFKPNNAFLAITGNVEPSAIVAKLEKVFGTWQKGDAPASTIPQVNDLGSAKIYLIDRPGSVQTNLVLGTLAIDRTDPDYIAFRVMNQVFGGSPSARLFLNLREDKGYTYGAYSQLNTPKYRGNFRANTEVRSEVTEGSMKELFYELKRIREEKVPTTELESAKRAIVGSFALQLESPQTLLNNIVTQKLYGLPADYWDTYPQKIAAVTPEDVQRVAQKYLILDKLQIVAVGDASKITEALKKYGTIEVYDTDGKPKAAASASSANSSAGGNVSLAGQWTLMVKTPDGNEFPLDTTIKVDGGKITGNIESPFGPSQIVGGEIKGEDVTLKIKAEVQGQTMEMSFTGKQSGKTLKGSISSNAFPPMDVNGTKKD
ncbi:MAG TPA: pitrilysin family protein, partial [Blastocatellia bacterium]|nr:pitrilysin family protein [Blastocatellia bacterium]